MTQSGLPYVWDPLKSCYSTVRFYSDYVIFASLA